MAPRTVPPTVPLIEAMQAYEALGRKRFHVPGHAGRDLFQGFLGRPVPGLTEETYRYDQTEVEGLDVLSEPSECLMEAQSAAAEAFRVANSYFLVNGSTAGLMAAMLACLSPGDRVLLPRNVHRSVISGLILTGAEPVWFLPEWIELWGLWGAVSPSAVQQAIAQNPDLKALVLTAPTYEGLGSDTAAIARLCREAGMFLIVDEAHGSLWPFSDRLPTSACHLPQEFSADCVVHSLHKTGGSLTQSAMAHLPHGSRIHPDDFQQALNTVQTTSPSYLLMASLDASRAYLASTSGQARIDFLLDQVTELRQQFKDQVDFFQLFEADGMDSRFWDPTKLYLRSSVEAGEAWAVRLEAEQRLTYEATSVFGSLYLAGLGLESEDYQFFQEVFSAQAKDYRNQAQLPLSTPDCPPLPLPDPKLTPREAFFSRGIRLPAEKALGRIAKETVVHCPPGIPVLLPGERIQEAHRPYLPDTLLVLA